MTTIRTRHYESTMTLEELETTCNTDELDIGGQIQSLDAVIDVNGKKVTRAVFDKINDTDLGEVTITRASDGPGSAFDGDAFILTVQTDVSVSRGE